MCIRDRVFFNELRYVLLQLLRWNLPCSKAHERFDNFAAQSVRLSNNAGFCYCWVFYKCAFNLKRTHTFSRGLYDVIDAPHKKEVTIFITKRTISRLEPSGNLKVTFILLFVSPYRMHHRRQRRLYDEITGRVSRQHLSCVLNKRCGNTWERAHQRALANRHPW